MEKSIILFGAGKIGKEALQFYGTDNVAAFCDNDPAMQGKHLYGKPIMNIKELSACYEKYKVVLAVGKNEIIWKVSEQLQALGIPYSLYSEEVGNRFINNSEVFEDVYANHRWGDGNEPFYSGTGSHRDEIIRPYITLLVNFILNNPIHTITEIGCGDFWIMREVIKHIGLNISDFAYHGVDIVKDLVQYNMDKFGTDEIHFSCMDACDEKAVLPKGDLLIIRQVLQHLSNEMIQRILRKANTFHFVLITEHIYDGLDAVYNLDKPTNGAIRLYKKSGVYLEKEPYNYRNIVHLLSVKEDCGIIRTSLLIN